MQPGLDYRSGYNIKHVCVASDSCLDSPEKSSLLSLSFSSYIQYLLSLKDAQNAAQKAAGKTSNKMCCPVEDTEWHIEEDTLHINAFKETGSQTELKFKELGNIYAITSLSGFHFFSPILCYLQESGASILTIQSRSPDPFWECAAEGSTKSWAQVKDTVHILVTWTMTSRHTKIRRIQNAHVLYCGDPLKQNFNRLCAPALIGCHVICHLLK